MTQTTFAYCACRWCLGLWPPLAPLPSTCICPRCPNIGTDLGSSMQAVQWTIVAYFMAFGLAQLVYGPWADQAGRKPPMYAGLALFMAGTVICALAPSVELLIFGRFVQGLGGAANMVVLRAVIRDLATGQQCHADDVDDHDRDRGLAAAGTLVGVGAAGVRVLAADLLGLACWRRRLSFFLIHFVLEETLRPEDRQKFDVATMRRGVGMLLRDRGFMAMTFLAGFAFASFFVFIASGVICLYRPVRPEPDAVFAGLCGQCDRLFCGLAVCRAAWAQRLGAAPHDRACHHRFCGLRPCGCSRLVLRAMPACPSRSSACSSATSFWAWFCPQRRCWRWKTRANMRALPHRLGGTMQMVAAGVLVAAAGPFLDGTVVPMLGAIALCGVLALGLSRMIPRQAAAGVNLGQGGDPARQAPRRSCWRLPTAPGASRARRGGRETGPACGG